MLTLSQAQGGGSRSLPSSCRSPAHLAGGGHRGAQGPSEESRLWQQSLEDSRGGLLGGQ